jgi:hypothetical protein
MERVEEMEREGQSRLAIIQFGGARGRSPLAFSVGKVNHLRAITRYARIRASFTLVVTKDEAL